MFNRSAKPNGDPLASLRADVQTAHAAALAAENALGELTIDLATQPDDTGLRKRRDKAAEAYADAKQRHASCQASLAAAEKAKASRAAREAATAAEKALAARWATGETCGKARLKAALAMESAAKDFGEAWRELEAATSGMNDTQLAFDPDGALLRAGELESAMRICLKQAGFAWAHWADRSVVEQIPRLSARIEAANAHFMAQRVTQ